MRLVTGDECGLLKEVIPELGRKKKDPKALIQPHSAMIDVTTTGMSQRVDPKEPQTRDRGVIDMVWMHQGEDFNSSFAVLRKNGSVDVWNSNCTETKQSFGDYSCLSNKTAVTTTTATTTTATATTPNNNSVFGTNNDSNSVGVGVSDNICRPLGLGYFREQNRLVAGDMFGNVVVLDAKNGNHCGIVQTYNSYTSSKGGTTISYTPGKMENMQLATAIGFDAHRGRVAVGGREREVCLTDLSTGKLVFKTKNTPPDPQTLLQQPVWPTAIRFLDEGSSSSPSPSNVMAVGTAYKQVRLYDVRESSGTRRPTSLTPEGLLEYRVTCLCQVGEHELVVGDAAGDIHTLDLRRLLVRNRNDSKGPAHAHNAHANRDMARYAGPAGSVRQLQKHPTLPRLVAVGLDRMVRVYDTTTREQLDCVYLKQRLNCLLIHQYDNLGSPEDNNNNNGVVSDEEYYSDDGVDMDQDDVVRDYVDSDDDEDIDESDNNNNNNNEGEPAGSDSASANESMDDDDDDDDDDENSDPQQEDESSDEDISGEEMSGDNSDESDEESGDDDNDDDDDEEEEEKTQQSKRRRRR